jgi:hypothetical protein
MVARQKKKPPLRATHQIRRTDGQLDRRYAQMAKHSAEKLRPYQRVVAAGYFKISSNLIWPQFASGCLKPLPSSSLTDRHCRSLAIMLVLQHLHNAVVFCQDFFTRNLIDRQ